MNERNVPEVRFRGFSGEWENKLFSEVFDTTIPNNTLSRANLNYEKGEVKNIHYGDILIKLGVITDVKKANIPFVTDLDITKYRGHFLADGDVIFADTAEDDTVGKATEITGIGVEKVVSGLHTIPVRPRNLKPVGYLGYYINSTSYHKQLLMLMQGIKVLSISKRNLANTSVIYPLSNSEQAKIGEFFKNLDDLIAQNQKKYDKLVNMKKACLDKMFPKDGADTPEVRFMGFGGEWEAHLFTDFIERTSIICNRLGLPRVEYEDIIPESGELNKDINKKESNKTGIFFESGDILFGKLRPYLKNWFISDFCGIAVGDFWILKPTEAVGSFVYYLMQNSTFQYISNLSSGTKMPRSDWSIVSKSQFLIASDEIEQTKIGNFFRTLDNLITLQKTKLEKLKNIKKACLDKMFI